MKRFLRIAGAALVTMAAALQAAQIGDPAAPLSVAEWVKGEGVSLADVKGSKIVVVEFWATWCPPCRASIPHLTELQKKFADRDVIFVGVSSEDPATVRPFVQQMGAKMDYHVAVDSNGQTSQAYMQAYGQGGIPCAFIVDREGRVAWVGHPMNGLEQKLEQLASAPAPQDPAAAKRTAARQQLKAFTELAAAGGDPARLAAMAQELAVLENELNGIEPGRKQDFKELRRSVRFQALMREYQSAVAAGKTAAELEKIEKEAAPLAPPGFRFESYRGEFNLQRTFQEYYRAVTGKGEAGRAEELAARLAGARSTDFEALNEMAWAILTDEAIKTRNLPLALTLAQTAFEASGGKEPGVLDTYARALFDNGKAAEAAARQKQAIDLTTDPDKKSALAETLKHYEGR